MSTKEATGIDDTLTDLHGGAFFHRNIKKPSVLVMFFIPKKGKIKKLDCYLKKGIEHPAEESPNGICLKYPY